jgi:hypothetical protein
MKNEELANVTGASCLGRMLAVPFFGSIYFNSSFFIFHFSFFILHSPLRGTRPNEWGFLDAFALQISPKYLRI